MNSGNNEIATSPGKKPLPDPLQKEREKKTASHEVTKSTKVHEGKASPRPSLKGEGEEKQPHTKPPRAQRFTKKKQQESLTPKGSLKTR